MKYVALMLLFLAETMLGQTISKVGVFSSYDGSVQFLPNASVLVERDAVDHGATNLYRHTPANSFAKVPRVLSAELRKWQSFNWNTVDVADQIARKDLESETLASLVPKGAKIKAFAALKHKGSNDVDIFLCYSSPSLEPLDPAQKELHIVMLTRGPLKQDVSYQVKADLVAAEESYFGTILLEEQPQGTFLVLYSSTGGGSHVINSVTVFLVR